MGKWSKKDHENTATRLLAKADQHQAAGNAEAVRALVIQVNEHRRLARESDR